MVLRKVQMGYDLKKNNQEHNLNHFLFIDNLKLFARLKEKINSVVQTVLHFSNDNGM